MRLQRYGFIFLAIYIAFIAGGYAINVPVIRWFHHILMTILATTWLAWRIRHHRGLPPSPLNIPLLTMLIIGFVSIPFSSDPRMALENMWTPLIFATGYWFIVNAFHRAQDRLLIESLFLVSAIVIFLSAIQIGDAFFGWIGIVRAPGQGWIEFISTGISFPLQTDMRIFLPLGVSTQVAGFVAPLIVITLTWAISTAKKGVRNTLAIMTVLLTGILILTFSRGGLISLTAGLFFLFVLHSLKSNRLQSIVSGRNKIILAGLVAGVIVVAGIIVVIGSQSGRRSGDSVRLDLWRSAVEMTVDNPITGVGTGLFGRELREYRDLSTARDRLSTAHNVYLTVTAEHGIGVLLILAGTIWLTGKSWWQLRREADDDPQRLFRLNGMMAALLAFAIHNLFDTLTTYAAVSLFSLMIIYCTVSPAKSRLQERPRGNQILAIILVLILAGYGIWFVAVVDRAHRHLVNSLDPQLDQLAEARLAREIDPALNLHVLQDAYLTGLMALKSENLADIATAISLYEEALILESTWDRGMINLATLHEINGKPEIALELLERSQTIISSGTVALHQARIADEYNLRDEDYIFNHYERALNSSPYAPLSRFWVETELRERTLFAYIPQLPLDLQYRVSIVHIPDNIPQIVPDNPQTAAEWWVIGEEALTIPGDRERAIEAFSIAIELAPNNGDYYASRARAYGIENSEQAERDLQIATFLGTVNEYPDAIRATLTSESEEREAYQRSAIPGITQTQEFEGVLYAGRVVEFLLYSQMRFPGRGDFVMSIWYDLATDYESSGEIDKAIEVYEAIQLFSPEDDRAVEELNRLQTEN